MKFSMKAIFAICFATVVLQAQTVQISGVVRDTSGLAVAGAQVNATQTDTGFTRTTQSAADGAYLLLNLPVGPYRLEAKQPGFPLMFRLALSCKSTPTPPSISL